MTIPDGVTKFVISGTLANGAESWACGLWFTGYGPAGAEGGLDPDIDSAGTNWTDWRDAILQRMSPDSAIRLYSVYHYTGGVASSSDSLAVNHAGTGGGGTMPAQIATVVTLRTALATRRGRGRIYLPTTAFEIMASSGKFASTNLDNLVNKTAALFSGIAVSTQRGVVLSQTAGLTHEITRVEADDVPDTQRRRTNKLVGVRHGANVTL
jgi:hypothetical protein